MSPPRTLHAGSREYVVATLRESGGQDLSEVSVEIAVTALGRRPDQAQWAVPDRLTRTPTTVAASVLTDAQVRAGERTSMYSVWLRVTDVPEVVVVHAGSYTVK